MRENTQKTPGRDSEEIRKDRRDLGETITHQCAGPRSIIWEWQHALRGESYMERTREPSHTPYRKLPHPNALKTPQSSKPNPGTFTYLLKFTFSQSTTPSHKSSENAFPLPNRNEDSRNTSSRRLRSTGLGENCRAGGRKIEQNELRNHSNPSAQCEFLMWRGRRVGNRNAAVAGAQWSIAIAMKMQREKDLISRHITLPGTWSRVLLSRSQSSQSRTLSTY